MPFVNYMLSTRVTEETAVRLKEQTADLVRQHTGKDEQWLFVRFAREQLSYFKGSKVENGGVVEVKLVGSLTTASKREIVRGISRLLAKELGIQADSLYVIFTEVKAEDWGWNNGTFG
ncbi:MAG TPA: phenylpyruvate tautomerase MIF-related protein [Spirochaetia bacterium]|nr:phenylpyruvate tautomerase MIF-related protein [Spirochaetia bacterium]